MKTVENNPPVQTSNETIDRELEVLKYWEENSIFSKSLEKPSPLGSFVFYDGPPYGTGTPHYGHLIPGTVKDIIPRYKTMLGYSVDRRWGWDCHGLPVENLIEAELGLKTKKEIESYGIEAFNKAAKASVLRYVDVWKQIIPRTGRWVDMKNAYLTMQSNFMESGWWVFKTLFDKGLVKKGFQPMHICPRCETPLSNFEVNLGYADVTDITVTAKFALVDEPDTYVLAWTTTPWTLPGNVALALGKDIEYVSVTLTEGQIEGLNLAHNETYVASTSFWQKQLPDFESPAGESHVRLPKDGISYIAKPVPLNTLLGQSYKPVFDYYSKDTSLENHANGWKVYDADFVTTEEGTGIVHIAPAFGSDDMELGKKHSLPFIQHVGIDGLFNPEVKDFAGMAVKKKGDTMSTDIEIVKWLAHNGKLVSKEKYVHSYPLCWRCSTPLLNYATSSWFIDVPAIKDKLLANNKKTSWVPESLRDGRFGNWLEGAKEWAVSRSRYWGNPLPVWENQETGKQLVIGSVSELRNYIKFSGNDYYVMRHGESESNVLGVISARNYDIHPLTDLGKEQALATAKNIKDKGGVDYVFVSPLLRTRQTADIIVKELGLSAEQVIVDDRLREQDPGDLEGGSWDNYHKVVSKLGDSGEKSWFNSPIGGGESYQDIKKRVGELFYEIESKYKNKKVLFVTHGGVAWIAHVISLKHLPSNQSYQEETHDRVFVKDFRPMKTAEIRELSFRPFPHDENYDLDLHRPFVDDIVLVDNDGLEYHRVKEVFDVWFDSGSMPYAKVHYPFNNEEDFLDDHFPADFIAEGVDQTRGWFYVLMVLSTALFDKPAFKQVVVNGLMLAEDGKKMSKSLKNYPEVDLILNQFGGDALRLFITSQPLVKAESAPLNVSAIRDAENKVLRRFRNVLDFYLLYKKDDQSLNPFESNNILDRWVIALVKEFSIHMTRNLDSYQIDQGARLIFDYVDNISTWYVRRSRDRLKGDTQDTFFAIATLRWVILESAKVMAPYLPFLAEDLWQKVKSSNEPESVHLASWPRYEMSEGESEVLEKMSDLRKVISEALLLRAQAGIKVRKPLASLTINHSFDKDYTELILEEVNVKKVIFGEAVGLDTNLTEDLIREGIARELIRYLQTKRKDAGLQPKDKVSLIINTNQLGSEVIEKWSQSIKEVVNVDNLEVKPNLTEAQAELSESDAYFKADLSY